MNKSGDTNGISDAGVGITALEDVLSQLSKQFGQTKKNDVSDGDKLKNTTKKIKKKKKKTGIIRVVNSVINVSIYRVY